MSEAVDNQKAFEGRLRGVDGDDVLLGGARTDGMHRCRCGSSRAAGSRLSSRIVGICRTR